MISSHIILVSGPFVRASSWGQTGKFLQRAGWSVSTPDIPSDRIQLPAWRDWTSHLLADIAGSNNPIMVGHSSAGPLVAEIASKIRCQSIIIVDGHIPPARGPVSPVRPALRDFIGQLEAEEGLLPIWSDWFSKDPARRSLVGLDRLESEHPQIFAHFKSGLRRFPATWIGDTIELSNWEGIPTGFIQTSKIYDYAVEEAQRRGWPCLTLQGTHLHPVLEPQETANTIAAMVEKLKSLPDL